MQLSVPDELKETFNKLEAVMGELKCAWVQKSQENESLLETQISLQEENSKLQTNLTNLNEKLDLVSKENELLKRDLEKERQVSSTFTNIASEYQAKIEELRELDSLKKDREKLKFQIEKLNLDKEKLEFALSK